MSLIGTLVAWRGSGDLRDVVAIDSDVEPFEVRGPWTVSYVDDEQVGTDAGPLLTELCQKTQAPALCAFVFESDCAFVSAAMPSGDFWSACLVRDIIAGLDSLDEAEMLNRYGSPAESAARGVAWAGAAGLTPDRSALEAAFAYTGLGADGILFPGVRLFDRLLNGLGLPPNETPTFYEEAESEPAPEGEAKPAVDSIVRHAAPVVIEGVGQFECELVSDVVLYIRISEQVADVLTAGAGMPEFALRTGFGRSRELPRPPADRVWIQASQGEAVLVIRREEGPDHAAFFYLGSLAQGARGFAGGLGEVQVFIVIGDEALTSLLATARPLGQITHPTMWGARVAATAAG